MNVQPWRTHLISEALPAAFVHALRDRALIADGVGIRTGSTRRIGSRPPDCKATWYTAKRKKPNAMAVLKRELLDDLDL